MKIFLGAIFIKNEFIEAILPSVWAFDTFEKKVTDANLNEQMWTFEDKANRKMTLIPEATAIFQQMVSQNAIKGEYKFFYITKCYRYERPQAGRLREFTQMGIEIINPDDTLLCLELSKKILKDVLLEIGIPENELVFDDCAKRGLGYYTQGVGFECKIEKLGAQKQIAGGGPYDCGVGFAIGLERILLALEKI